MAPCKYQLLIAVRERTIPAELARAYAIARPVALHEPGVAWKRRRKIH
jgi:hypothetical protein